MATGKRIPHYAPVQEMLETIRVPNLDFATLHFNDRIREIKQSLARQAAPTAGR